MSETSSVASGGAELDVRPADHPAIDVGGIGVLLVNLGTPDATDYWSMRRYLKEFLSDRRVIETPRVLWWPILNGIILTTRPKKSGAAYDQIWDRERDESPLRTFTRSQAACVQKFRVANTKLFDQMVAEALQEITMGTASMRRLRMSLAKSLMPRACAP